MICPTKKVWYVFLMVFWPLWVLAYLWGYRVFDLFGVTVEGGWMSVSWKAIQVILFVFISNEVMFRPKKGLEEDF